MSEGAKKRNWSAVNRRASRIVNLRLTPEEEAELRDRAASEQTSVSHYLKAAALARPITRKARTASRADIEALRMIHADLGRLAGNSYQIVRALNFGRNVPEAESLNALREIRESLRELRAVIFTALERDP